MSKEEKALESIKEYMLTQNRPYSPTDVMNNLRKEFSKPIVTKTLEALAASGVLVEKMVSKQKIYFPNQDQFPSYDAAEAKDIDQKVAALGESEKTKKTLLKTLETELKGLTGSLTTEELVGRVGELEKSCESLSGKLALIKQTASGITEAQKQQIMGRHVEAVKEWRKRKRMATDILETIFENSTKKKKDILDDIGIETDEDNQVSVPQLKLNRP